MKRIISELLSCIFIITLALTGFKAYAVETASNRITGANSEATASTAECLLENSEETKALSSITMKDGYITSITFPEPVTGTVYVAVYEESGRFSCSEFVQADNAETVSLKGTTAYNTDTENIKCFVPGTDMQPQSVPYIYNAGTYVAGDGIIHLQGTSVDATGVEGVTVSGTTVTIGAAGEYSIEGTLNDGQIVVNAATKKDEITLYLTNVSVTCSTGNALDATLGKVTITNTSGSTSTFTSTYGTEEDTGTGIYSKNDLTIKGEDASTKLIASSTYGNGIRCKADLEIGLGDLEVTAGNNGIKGDEGVKITKKAGVITVNATGDALKTDAIDSDTLELEYEKGNIIINGGTLSLTAGGDGIQADDTVTISGGSVTVNATADGIKANTANTLTYDDDSVASNIEGNVKITGGTVYVNAQEDGIKAAGKVAISGGDITVISVLDAIQSGVDYTDVSGDTAYSTGNLEISAGTVNVKTGGGYNAKRTDDDSHKGIKAYNNLAISGGEITVNSYDDAIHSNYTVAITGGSFEISSGDDGIHADYKLTLGTQDGSDSDYSINISNSYEGIEGSVIEYLSGTTYIYSTDDGVNAAGDYNEDGTLNSSSSSQETEQPGHFNPRNPGDHGGRDPGADDSSSCGSIYIKGGGLYISAYGDGLDSNGDIAMSGGVVIVNGTTSNGNGVFDKGDNNNVFTVTGGTLVGFGTTSMVDTPTTVSNGYYKITNFALSKGTPFSVSTDTGRLIIVPEITMTKALLYVTCGDMTKGKNYSVSSGASTAGATEILCKTVGSTVYGLLKTTS